MYAFVLIMHDGATADRTLLLCIVYGIKKRWGYKTFDLVRTNSNNLVCFVSVPLTIVLYTGGDDW